MPNQLTVLHLLKRAWLWLALLVVSVPIVWAAGGVSINNVVITTVKQLWFAQARAELMVGAQFTQTVSARLSTGAISYRSSDTTVATVDARTGQVTGVLAGQASIIADQAVLPPYPTASASYAVKVKGQPISFNPWQLASVMYGMPGYQITAPTSNVQGATITYSLKDKGSTVAIVTEQGMVTVKAVGKTTIVATQKPFGLYDGSTIEAELEVTSVPGLNDVEIAYTTEPVALPAQLGGQNVSYTSSVVTVANVIGTSSPAQLSLKGLGATVLEAKNAAGIVVAKATWTVVPGQPNLTVEAVPPLPSTTFETTLHASSNSVGQITYSIPNKDESDWIAEIEAITGRLVVKGPGLVMIKVSQAQSGNFTAREITVPVSINDGRPGVVLTSWPTQSLKTGDTFEVRYRVNFMSGTVGGWIALSDPNFMDINFPIVSHIPPTRPGEDGVFRFQVSNAAQSGIYPLVLSATSTTFSQSVEPGSDPALVRSISLNASYWFNLGPPITMVYGDKPVMPRTYDPNGVEVTDGNQCINFNSSNWNVLKGTGIGPAFDKDHWQSSGVGETVISCFGTVGGTSVAKHASVAVKMIGADPRLQAFPAIEIGMDSSPYPLQPAASLNGSGTWRYEIVPVAGQPTVATIVDGKIVPQAPGTAKLRATQAAANNFRESFIEADLTVKPAQVRDFANILATYGDPDLDLPRPTGVSPTAAIQYRFVDPNQDVAIISNGKIQILKASLNAGTTPIELEASVGTSKFKGWLTVRRAKPRLMFYFPPGLYFSKTCGEVWTWPVANQGTNNRVNGTLITNSDGQLFYPMGSENGSIGNTGPNKYGDPYYMRYMGHSAYTSEMAVYQDAWVVQFESRNFEAAQSPKIKYAVWGNDRVAWSYPPWAPQGAWVLSCDQ